MKEIVTTRIPIDLKEQIKETAEENGRSMGRQVELILTDYMMNLNQNNLDNLKNNNNNTFIQVNGNFINTQVNNNEPKPLQQLIEEVDLQQVDEEQVDIYTPFKF